MIQVAPAREQLALTICEGMWGADLAELYARGGDVRWNDALRAADAVIAKHGPPPTPSRIPQTWPVDPRLAAWKDQVDSQRPRPGYFGGLT